jgi:hemerythrin
MFRITGTNNVERSDSMAELFQWKPEYSVSVSKCDAQHKKLFLLADNLHRAMREGRGRQVLSSLLNELVSYTRTHFAAEEDILAGSGYPDLARHRAEHARLLEQVDQFQKDFAAGKTQISIDLMDFLQNWISNHILQTDSHYSNYLNAQGVY